MALDIAVNDSVAVSKNWTTDRIRERSISLAEAIVSIWPEPLPSVRSVGEAVAPGDDAVLLLPEGAYTTVADLAEYWSMSEEVVLQIVSSWPTESLARVLRDEGADSLDTLWRGAEANESLSRRFGAPDLARLVEEEDAQYLEQSDS